VLPGFRLSGEWQHLGRYYMDAANTETYPGYNVLNLRAGYHWKGLEVWLNALNATNRLYATTADKSAFGKSYRPGNPRTFALGVAYHVAGRPERQGR
jgi:outer membrane receptor for monomeric catechols